MHQHGQPICRRRAMRLALVAGRKSACARTRAVGAGARCAGRSAAAMQHDRLPEPGSLRAAREMS